VEGNGCEEIAKVVGEQEERRAWGTTPTTVRAPEEREKRGARGKYLTWLQQQQKLQGAIEPIRWSTVSQSGPQNSQVK
jgi:hypothetical protein